MNSVLRFIFRAGGRLSNPFHPARAYYRPRQGDGRHDFKRVMGDMQRVGGDIRKVADRELSTYGQ